MILSNVEIHRALDEQRLIINPEPEPRFQTLGGRGCPYDTHSVDLRLGNKMIVPESGQLSYDLTQPGRIADTISTHSREVTITDEQPFKLDPCKFVLGQTSPEGQPDQ